MSKYRRRPLVDEAVQFTARNKKEVEQFIGVRSTRYYLKGECVLKARVGGHRFLIHFDDWVVKFADGKFGVRRPDIFEQAYEGPVDESSFAEIKRKGRLPHYWPEPVFE